jgi:hypothetical protein
LSEVISQLMKSTKVKPPQSRLQISPQDAEHARGVGCSGRTLQGNDENGVSQYSQFSKRGFPETLDVLKPGNVTLKRVMNKALLVSFLSVSLTISVVREEIHQD